MTNTGIALQADYTIGCNTLSEILLRAVNLMQCIHAKIRKVYSQYALSNMHTGHHF